MSDNSYALTGTGDSCGAGNFICSNYLKATGFNFSLPANATIDGIQAEIERKGVNTPPYDLPQDYGVKIVKNGVIQGNSQGMGFWPVADTYQSFGGANYKWGLSWIAGDINSSNFGVAISVALNGDPDDGWGLAYVDHIRIKVYYHTGGMDAVKVSNVTIAGDGSVSTDLNADKLDGLHASEIGRQGLYGSCVVTYFGAVSGADYCITTLVPAYADNPGCGDIVPSCRCLSGYQLIQTGGPNSAFPPKSTFLACYKQ